MIGPPASGKTTVARWLGSHLEFPCFGKDDFKEVLFGELGVRDQEWSQLLGKTSIQLLFYAAGRTLLAGQSVVLDGNLDPTLDSPRAAALKAAAPIRTLQVLCQSPPSTLRRRFDERAVSGERHGGHADTARTYDFDPLPRPLEIDGPIVSLDTSDLSAIYFDQVTAFISGAGQPPHASPTLERPRPTASLATDYLGGRPISD